MPRAAVTKATLRKASKEFKIDGLDELYANLERILKTTDRGTGVELKRLFMRAALELVDRVRQRAPYRAKYRKTKIKTHLRDAIFADYGQKDKPNVLAGINTRIAPQGRWIEYGTSRMQARPFWRPSISESRARMGQIIVSGFQKLIASKIK